MQKNKIVRKVLSIIGLPVLIILLYFFYRQFHFIWFCPFYKLTGWYCPGCGMTRCFISLLQLDFYQAFRYNSFGFILLPFLFLYVEYQCICWGFQKSDNITKKIPNWIWYSILILFLCYGLLRNIDAFNWLAPTKVY